MFSRAGALYVGHAAVPGEVRLRRDRLSVVSHERERTVGTIEQDYYFDDVAMVSLTRPSWSRPRRTLRLEMLDGSVEHVWVQEWADSFAQLERAFDAHREAHPAPERDPAPNRSTNEWADRVGTGVSPRAGLVLFLVSLVGLVLYFTADTLTVRLIGLGLAAGPTVLRLVASRRRRRRS